MSSEYEAWMVYKEAKTRRFLERALSALITLVEEKTGDTTLTHKLKGFKDSIIIKAIKELP